LFRIPTEIILFRNDFGVNRKRRGNSRWVMSEEVACNATLESRVGQRFDAMVAASPEKETRVCLFRLPTEGELTRGFQRLEIRDRIRVCLIQTG
jgi:hypothetical protein